MKDYGIVIIVCVIVLALVAIVAIACNGQFSGEVKHNKVKMETKPGSSSDPDDK